MGLARHHRRLVLSLCVLTCLLYIERSTFPLFVKNSKELAHLSKTEAGRLLSLFYVGYFVTQLPGGWLAWQYGGDVVLVRSTLAWGAITLTISAEVGGPALLPLLRVSVGCLQGLAFPAIHSVLADSLAAEDRPRVVALVTSGMYFGTALAQGHWGLARTEMGWVGAAAVAWALHHHVLRGPAAAAAERSPGARREQPTICGFLRSPAVLVVLSSSFAFHVSAAAPLASSFEASKKRLHQWTFYTLLSWLPFLFHEQEVDSTVLRATPFIAMWAVTASSGAAADALAKRLGTLSSRKLMTCGGLCLSVVPCHFLRPGMGAQMSVLLIALCLGCATLSRGGFGINHLDLAPTHAGLVLALVNSAGTVAGVVGVAVAGALLDGNDGQSEWGLVFALSGCVAIAGSLLFAIFASVEDQFSKPKSERLPLHSDSAK